MKLYDAYLLGSKLSLLPNYPIILIKICTNINTYPLCKMVWYSIIRAINQNLQKNLDLFHIKIIYNNARF